MKIYTKTGDDGTTGLIGGDRVRKCDPRLDCYGTIDETNAAIGLAAVTAPVALVAMLRDIQNDLFVIGSHLATPPESAYALLLRSRLMLNSSRSFSSLSERSEKESGSVSRIARMLSSTDSFRKIEGSCER